jgi:hypothetical protein
MPKKKERDGKVVPCQKKTGRYGREVATYPTKQMKKQ